jgi:hypothetical protein
MLTNYVLIGQTPVPEPDLLTWAESFEHCDRHVAKTRVLDLCEVSTIFLGIDHNWSREGPPVLFETMIFWGGDRSGSLGDAQEQCRCCTWAEAEAMHAEAVRYAASPGALCRYFLREAVNTLAQLRDDWRALWTTP